MTGPLNVMRRWWRRPAPPPHSPKVVHSAPAPTPKGEPPWRRVLRAAGAPSSLIYPSTTLSRVLDQTAERFPDSIALIYGERSWTYRRLLSDVNRIAGGLAQYGVHKGDRVVLALPNSPEFVAAFFAIQKLGAVVVNVGPLMGADDLQKVMAITTPQVAIALDLRIPAFVKASRGNCSIQHWVWSSLESYQGPIDRIGYRMKRWYGGNGFVGAATHTTLTDLMAQAPARPPTIEPDMEDVALLQPTGGTTGVLKLAQLSHRNLLSNAMQVDACMASRQAQERILAVLPMFHVYGLTTCLISGVFSASQIILLTRFDPAKTMQAIRAHSPTIFPLVPAICESLCNEIESTGGSPAPLKSVRLCLSGAAPLPKATVDRFIRVAGIEPLEGYGLTEAGPVTHANLPGVSRVGSIGVPLPDTFARIASFADPDHDAAFDEPGELLISGPQIMRGYFGDPDLNRGVLTTDESGRVWLHTGDVASVDKDGYFHIVDRQKDMIIRSGLKVYPSRVEQVLLKHPSVKEVAVFGRPDPVHTERVSAAIVLHHPTQNSQKLVSDLRDFCRQHLAAYEVPEAIEFLEAIPKSPLGKVLKRQLRDSSPEPKPSSPPRPKGVAA